MCAGSGWDICSKSWLVCMVNSQGGRCVLCVCISMHTRTLVCKHFYYTGYFFSSRLYLILVEESLYHNYTGQEGGIESKDLQL